jgi:hypothetical protein
MRDNFCSELKAFPFSQLWPCRSPIFGKNVTCMVPLRCTVLWDLHKLCIMETEPSKCIIPRRPSDLQFFSVCLCSCADTDKILLSEDKHFLTGRLSFEKYKTTLSKVYVIEIELSKYWNWNVSESDRTLQIFCVSLCVWHRFWPSCNALIRIQYFLVCSLYTLRKLLKKF